MDWYIVQAYSGFEKKVVDAILNSAKTTENGQIGDGKIFISEISDVIRVRTGDTGKKAL